MRFQKFFYLTENGTRTGAKLGLYPDLADNVGQYPPLYAVASSADYITYLDIVFGKKGIKSRSPGIIEPDSFRQGK
jgi:hypothetical protein